MIFRSVLTSGLLISLLTGIAFCVPVAAAPPADTPANSDRERLIVELLVAGLADRSPEVRDNSERRLSARNLPVGLVTAALAKAIQNANENTAPDALRSYAEFLGALGPEAVGASDILLKQLQPDSPLRRASGGQETQALLWVALARIGVTEKALPAIEAALRSDSPSQFAGAARAAGALGVKAGTMVPLLMRALETSFPNANLDPFFQPLSPDTSASAGHGSTTAQREAVTALGKIGAASAPAITLLRQIAQEKSKEAATLEDALAAVKALEDMGATAREAFVQERANLLKGTRLSIGQPVPDLPLEDLTGQTQKLLGTGDQMVALVFVDTECPCVPAYDKRMQSLYERFKDRGLRVIYLFANPRDTVQGMTQLAAQGQYPWVTAQDRSGVAQLFQARVATEVCLVDRKGILRYRGRIDDNVFEPEAVKERSLEDAIQAVLSGREVSKAETTALGCAFPAK